MQWSAHSQDDRRRTENENQQNDWSGNRTNGVDFHDRNAMSERMRFHESLRVLGAKQCKGTEYGPFSEWTKANAFANVEKFHHRQQRDDRSNRGQQ